MNLLNLILSGIVSCLFSYFSIISLSKTKINYKKLLIYFIFFIPTILLTYLYFEGITRLALNILFMVMGLYISLFRKEISDSVYYTLAYEMLAFISEFVISVIILVLFKFNANMYSNFPFSLLISSILNCSLVYSLTKISFISKNIRKFNDIIKKNNKDWVYIILVMFLMILLMTVNRYKMNSTVEYYICILIIIFVVLSFVYVIYNKFQRQAIEDKYN